MAEVKVSNEDDGSFSAKLNAQMKLISDKSGIPAPICLIGLGASVFFVFIGFFSGLITNIVGIVYPAISSIRAIETSGGEDDKQWLTYWAVFGAFHIFDMFSNFILSFIPFYFLFKVIFLIWLMMPNTQGAVFIYNKFLHVFFKKVEKYEPKFD